MYIRRLTRALPATLTLALIWPAVAAATPVNADLDGDKVTESLEDHIDPLPDDREVRLIVSLDRAATNGRVKALERAVGDMDVHRRFSIVDAFAVTATKEQVRELAAEGVVDRVEASLPITSFAGPFTGPSSDSAHGSFGVTDARLQAPLLDGNLDDPEAYTPDDLVAAVIDSGIDATHDDLDDGKVLAFADCSNGTGCVATPAYDDNGHGTHVAATIAGEGEGEDEGAGHYPGVAPGAGLVGVKVLDENGGGDDDDLLDGIQWAVDHKDDYGIEAINLSLGPKNPTCGDGLSALSQAVDNAWGAGLVVTVAAGNHGPGKCTIGPPGDAKPVITVGSMADLGESGFMLAKRSGRGPAADASPADNGHIKPDITAPGVGITSAEANTNAFVEMSGTSMATPFVAGVALLMMDANTSFNMDDVKRELYATAVDWGRGDRNDVSGSTGLDVDYGNGRLDAYAALAAADPTLAEPPAAPAHTLREGSLAAKDYAIEYEINVADTIVPLAATMIQVPTGCASQDFDMELTAPNGALVAAQSPLRQDELGYAPTVTGQYTLRVYSFEGCGDFFLDISGGTVGSSTSSSPDTDPDKTQAPPVVKPTPSTPARPDESAAFAAVANAARITARRATSRVRRVGLRRLLRRSRFTFAGLTHGAGRVQLAIRMSHRGRKVLVARAVRTVTKAGKPRLNVRLTRAGRRLLRRPRSVRLTIRAAVTDTSNRRRYVDRSVRVRR